MPQDTRNIVITLKNEAGNNLSQDLDTNSTTDTSSTSSKNSNSMAKAAWANMAMSLAQTTLNEIVSWADYDINKYMNLHDDYIGQRNMNIATHYINGSVSAASTIASSALVGAAAGPIGAIIGAIFGTGVVLAKNIRSNIQANDQQNIQLKQLDLQLQYTRRRAGWSTTAAGIGEDL